MVPPVSGLLQPLDMDKTPYLSGICQQHPLSFVPGNVHIQVSVWLPSTHVCSAGGGGGGSGNRIISPPLSQDMAER